MEVHTLEKLTQEPLDLETKPREVQRQVIELKNELLNYESLKPSPFPVPRMRATKHTPTTPTPAFTSTQSEIFSGETGQSQRRDLQTPI